MDLSLLVNDFRQLFTGNTQAYGQHNYGIDPESGSKREGTSSTVKGRPEQANYLSHLRGEKGLGIVPINHDNEVKFVALDVDIYNQTEKQKFDAIIKAIEYHNAPIAIFATKSGGFHFYVFFEDFVKAKDGLEILRKYADLFGIRKTASTYQKQPLEYFPKQETLPAGKTGNWLNLPYYDQGSLGQKMLHEGRKIDLDEALMRIKKDLRRPIEFHRSYIEGVDLHDAPPCLQTISLLGDPPGGRNNFLFSMGVYFMKKDEDSFEANMFEANKKLLDPIPERELESTILSSLRRNEYSYKCKEAPCQNFCDKRECSKRTFGLGDSGEVSNIHLGQMWRVQAGVDASYFWEIDGKEIHFESEKHIIDQGKFQEILMRELQVIPLKLKANTWYKMVNKCLTNLEIKETAVSDTEGINGELYSCLGRYLDLKSSDKGRGAILEGMAYRDEKEQRFYLTGQNFKTFAIKSGVPRGEIPKTLAKLFSSLEGEKTVVAVKKAGGARTTRYCYSIPFTRASEIMNSDPFNIDETEMIKARAKEVDEERQDGYDSGEELY